MNSGDIFKFTTAKICVQIKLLTYKTIKMKKILLSLALSMACLVLFGQIKVSSPNSYVQVGVNSGTPVRNLEVNSAGTTSRLAIISSKAGAKDAGLEVYQTDASSFANFLGGFLYDGASQFFSLYGPAGTTGAINMGTDGSITFRHGGTSALLATLSNTGSWTTSGFTSGSTSRSTKNTAMLMVNGPAVTFGNGSFLSVSDRSVQRNVNKFTAGLSEVMALNPVTYKYNGQNSSPRNSEVEYIGLVAQEAQRVAPYLVSEITTKDYSEVETNADENSEATGTPKDVSYLAVDAAAINYMLINAVKEQQAIIEDLTKRLEAVEGKSKTPVINNRN